MKLITKIITAILGIVILMPGIAKFSEPFKTFIYQHIKLIVFPLSEIMQHIVKFSEVGIGLMMIFIAFLGHKLNSKTRDTLFFLGNTGIISMMIVAIYTHLHPDVPAEILPLEYKPPVMAVAYLILAIVNLILNRKKINS